MSACGSTSLMTNRTFSCRSPDFSSKMSTLSSQVPGTRCLVFLKRCLAIQLQKVGSFPITCNAPAMSATTTSCTDGGGGGGGHSHVRNYENNAERAAAPLYWMYDSGYLVFQGFLEANLKCFWNGALIEAMKVLEFQGYIAPGVLLVNGSPCALEVVRAAWARNVLKPPNNYVITVVGDVDDCLVEPISQGQFTPLPEALCWIILDMTASGQAAVMESICSTLEIAFPDIQKPSRQLVYDTLAKLMAEKKLYQTSNGYFVMTPDKMRLSGLTNSTRGDSCGNDMIIGSHHKQILLTPEEAVVMMHGEIETVRDGNVTHQAIQTNLADVICGGNPNDKILYPRVSFGGIRSGSSTERLERRHSMRFFGHGRRSRSLQRTGSVRHLSDTGKIIVNDKAPSCKDTPASDDVTRKPASLFSRLFRRSGRVRRDNSPSCTNRPTFSAQFPPSEWFNRGVTHQHSVGTQTTYLAPSTDTLPKRNFDYEFDQDLAFHDTQSSKKRISTFGTPRTVRRASQSATLPRRSMKKPTLCDPPSDKDSMSRICSQMSVTANESITVTSPATSSHSSFGSLKTVVSKEQLPCKQRVSPAHKSLSSASSGYNSLPRSISDSVRSAKLAAAIAASGSSSGGGGITKSSTAKLKPKPKDRESSITFHVSAKNFDDDQKGGGSGDSGCGTSRTQTSTKTETSATTMTTTINSGNKTKIFVQQHNTPCRSFITFENSSTEPHRRGSDIVITNRSKNTKENNGLSSPPTRPNSLCVDQNNLKCYGKKPTTAAAVAASKTKFPSIEAIDDDEGEGKTSKTDNRKLSNVNILKDLSSSKNLSKNGKFFGSSGGCFGSETELNNAKNYALCQNSNVDKIILNNLKRENVQKEFENEANSEPTSPTVKHDVDKFRLDFEVIDAARKELECLNLDDDTRLKKYSDFPSLSDLSLRFTSLAAQNILKGVSYNSVDTLVEVNMAAEKKRNCEMSISTDLGVV